MAGYLYLLALIAIVFADVVPLGLHGSPEYVDLVKNSPRWQAITGGPKYEVDENGWPMTDFMWVFDDRKNKPWEGPDFNGQNNNVSGTYHMSFSGTAQLSGTGSWPGSLLFKNQNYNPSTQTTTVDVEVLPGHFLFMINFANTKRPGGAAGSGLTNLRFLLPGYPLSTTKLFTDRFVNLVTGLKSHTFRSFDTGINGFPIWNGANLVINKWSDRSLPSDAYWPLAKRNGGPISGLAMPWEIFMQITIQTNSPGWFNLPVGADDDYVLKFAQLLQKGNSFTPPIPSNMPFYIEYSNEVWNWGFSQSIYNEVLAKKEGISTIQRYVNRLFEISLIFRQVFGDEVGSRVRFNCMWQYGNWNAMQNALMNASSTYKHPVNYFIWGIGEAPYFDSEEPANVLSPEQDPDAVDRIIDSMYTSIGTRRQAFASWQALATFFGIHQVGYESGPSLVGSVQSDASRSPRMQDLMHKYYMENYFATGADTVNYFALGPGAPGSYGDWYLFEQWETYQNYGRYLGYMSVSGQQRPTLSVGYVLPWTVNKPVTIDPSQYDTYTTPGSTVFLCPQGCWPTPNVVNYLLRSTTTGTYQIQISGSGRTGSSFQIWFNNQLLSTVSFPTQGSVATTHTTIKPGLSTLTLLGVTGQTQIDTHTGITITLVSGMGQPTPPSPPLNLRTQYTESYKINLSWENVTTARNYVIQRSTKSGSGYSTIGQTSYTNFTDSSVVVNNVMYYYVVMAQNEVGNSALSIQVEVIAIRDEVKNSPTVNVAVGLEDGYGFGGLGQAFVQWNAVPDALYYTIQRNGKNTGDKQKSTRFFEAGLSPGEQVTYTITANGLKSKTMGTSQTATIPTSSTPGTPQLLKVTPTAGNNFLKWQQPMWSYPELGELFRVERAPAPNGPWTAISTPSVNSFLDVGVKTACYRVWATNGKGASSSNPSNTACSN